MSEFTKEQIVEAAKCCLSGAVCHECPLPKNCGHKKNGFIDCGRIKNEFIISLAEEKEPAPSETDTSSKENIVYKDDSTALKICQELISQAQTDLLTIYDGMSEEECRAWELGELFKTLEFAKKAGEQE